MGETMRIEFVCNGKKTVVEARPGMRALDLLRDLLGLTGTKEVCGRGECGACTILLDGEPVNACLLYAAKLQGRTYSVKEVPPPRARGDLGEVLKRSLAAAKERRRAAA